MRKTVALMAAVLLMCAAGLFAQEKKKKGEETTRSVEGAVMAPDEKAVVGAVVQLKNTKTLQIRSFITKENGTYYFHELSPDVDYELKADYQGASSGAKKSLEPEKLGDVPADLDRPVVYPVHHHFESRGRRQHIEAVPRGGEAYGAVRILRHHRTDATTSRSERPDAEARAAAPSRASA